MFDVEVIIVEVRVHVMVLNEVLMLLLSSTVHNLSSSDIIMLRVHSCSNNRVNAVLTTEHSILLFNDEVLNVTVIALWYSHGDGLLGFHLHKGVV